MDRLPKEGERVVAWWGTTSQIAFYGLASFSERACWRFAYDHAEAPPPDGWVSLSRAKAADAVVVEAAKAYRALPAEEERLRKEYPAGSCNAEDAWRDFAKHERDVTTRLDAALAAAGGVIARQGGRMDGMASKYVYHLWYRTGTAPYIVITSNVADAMHALCTRKHELLESDIVKIEIAGEVDAIA